MGEQLLLAIDGGGTKTDACIARWNEVDRPEIIGRARGGPSNLTTLSLDEVIAELTSIITAAADNAALSSSAIPSFNRAIVALAGAGDQDYCRGIQDWLSGESDSKHVDVVSDAELMLAIAESLAPEGCASIALVAGTGSVAFGRHPETDDIVRAGGWGPLLGDDGSGFWVGRAAVRAALEAVDSQNPLTGLVAAVYESTGTCTARELISKIHESQDPTPAVASLAPIVFAAAQRGDETAREILIEAAVCLGLLISQVKNKLPHPAEQIVVACGGSLITSKTILTERVEELVKSNGIRELYFVEEPASAAIQLAASLKLSD